MMKRLLHLALALAFLSCSASAPPDSAPQAEIAGRASPTAAIEFDPRLSDPDTPIPFDPRDMYDALLAKAEAAGGNAVVDVQIRNKETLFVVKLKDEKGAIRFDDLDLTIGNSDFSGHLVLDKRSARPQLSGRLSSKTLDLGLIGEFEVNAPR